MPAASQRTRGGRQRVFTQSLRTSRQLRAFARPLRACHISAAVPETTERIYLAVPHMGGAEQRYVQEAFESNWVSTVGPNLTAFETSLFDHFGRPAVALSSGTGAIHLGLTLLGVQPGDEVICSTLTFVASANPIRYVGAYPVFVDSQYSDWNMDPARLEEALEARKSAGRRVAAVIPVHLYGQTCDMDTVNEICARFEVPVLEDAAEALGATYKGKAAGTLSPIAAISFNGNKIITTSGGGALVSSSQAHVDRARFLSTQARDPGVAYEHTVQGYNYRLSNVLAGIGRGQMEVLEERVAQKRALFARYCDGFSGLGDIEPMPEAEGRLHTRWLSTFLLRDSSARDRLIEALAAQNIEARPVWKPMHLQPLFADCPSYGGEVAQALFERGICLPSSTNMSSQDQDRVVEGVRKVAQE